MFISEVEMNAKKCCTAFDCFGRLCESQPWSFSYFQGSAPMAHPEDELERLTKKMLFDMDNPPSEEYFGKIAHLALT